MSFSIISSKLTGNPGESGWAQVHDFEPKDSEKRSLRGRLFAVVATEKVKEKVDSIIVGRELLARLHEEYFGTTSGSAFNALKDAIEKIIAEFKESWGDVQISAVSVLGDVVYSAAGGGAQVAIFRDGMLAKILVSKKKGAVSASGYPKLNDILILGTRSFFDTFPGGTLKAALDGKDPRATVESLAPTAHSGKGRGDLGAAFLKFEKEKSPLREDIGVEERLGKGEDRKVRKEKTILLREKYASLKQAVRKVLLSKLSKLPERKIYVKEGPAELEVVQNRRLAVSVGAILLSLLLVSIGFGVKQKRNKETRQRYETRLVKAQHEFEEAVGLLTLDAGRARELFIESREKVDQLLSEGVSDSELDELKKNLDEHQGAVLGEYTQKAELFVDLSLLSDGFKGGDLASSEEKLFVLDIKGEKVAEVSVDTKRARIVAGPDQIEEGQLVAAYSDRVFVLNRSGIDEVREGKEQVIEADWSGAGLPYAYAGNLYVLDKDASVIWRYPGTSEGFAAGKNWFTPGVEPNLSKIISWTIDGTVWLLDDSGNIFKFSLGNRQTFMVSGITPPLVSPKAIYTNEEQKFLYLLDPGESRVVVLTKSGDYKAQYISEKTKEASDLAVSEKESKIIFLAGEKLYSIEMEHLEE